MPLSERKASVFPSKNINWEKNKKKSEKLNFQSKIMMEDT
jgi:hypothetical protein